MKVTRRKAKRKKSLKTTEGARITTYMVEDGLYPIIVALKENVVVLKRKYPKGKKYELKCLPGFQTSSPEVRTL